MSCNDGLQCYWHQYARELTSEPRVATIAGHARGCCTSIASLHGTAVGVLLSLVGQAGGRAFEPPPSPRRTGTGMRHANRCQRADDCLGVRCCAGGARATRAPHDARPCKHGDLGGYGPGWRGSSQQRDADGAEPATQDPRCFVLMLGFQRLRGHGRRRAVFDRVAMPSLLYRAAARALCVLRRCLRRQHDATEGLESSHWCA